MLQPKNKTKMCLSLWTDKNKLLQNYFLTCILFSKKNKFFFNSRNMNPNNTFCQNFKVIKDLFACFHAKERFKNYRALLI